MRLVEALRQALEDPERVGRAVLAVEAAQQSWTAPTFYGVVRSVAWVLDEEQNDPRRAVAWLAAVDNRFATTPIERMREALRDWREASSVRRPGRPSKDGPPRTCTRVIWDLCRWAGVTNATEATVDREVRRALRSLRRGRNQG